MLTSTAVIPNYAEIFNQRADDYHAAMRRLPQARHAEFATLFRDIPLCAQNSIIDIPSGGGYLQQHIAVDCTISSFDFSTGFAHEGGQDIHRIDGNAKAWAIGSANRVVSLAGLHHFDDPLAIIARLYTHVAAGGVLHVADVAADSAPAHFLNGFVDRHNAQGHEGIFLPTARDAWPSDWNITRLRQENIPWVFRDAEAMTWFCCKLFGVPLSKAKAMQHELATTIGYTETAESCQMHWSLLYVDVLKPEAQQ